MGVIDLSGWDCRNLLWPSARVTFLDELQQTRSSYSLGSKSAVWYLYMLCKDVTAGLHIPKGIGNPILGKPAWALSQRPTWAPRGQPRALGCGCGWHCRAAFCLLAFLESKCLCLEMNTDLININTPWKQKTRLCEKEEQRYTIAMAIHELVLISPKIVVSKRFLHDKFEVKEILSNWGQIYLSWSIKCSLLRGCSNMSMNECFL